MVAAELAALAGTGAAPLVSTMTTESWHTARSGIARLFSHAGTGRRAAIEAQLDGNAELVAQSLDPDKARRSLVGFCALELEGLLSQYPDAAGDLRTLRAQVQAALAPAQQHGSRT